MKGRPTRFCSICGHYVAERYVPAPTHSEPARTVKRLAHIDTDGRVLTHLAHAAKEN